MKNILVAIAVLTTMTITSCYVGVSGGHRRHAASIQINADNTTAKDSLHTSAGTEINKNDSAQSPSAPGAVKK